MTENATPLAFALIVFNAPILLTIACVLAAFYGYAQAYYYRTRVALIAGRNSIEALSLQQREYTAMTFLPGLCTTLSIGAFADQQAKAFAWRWWLLLISSCLFFSLIAFGTWRRFRGSNRYYSQLPYAELGWEMAQKKKGFGRTNHEIAEALVVSDETVKTHVGNILTKLQLAHRTQAVIYALKKGLISIDELELP